MFLPVYRLRGAKMDSQELGIIMLCLTCAVPFVLGVVVTRSYYRGTLVPGWIRRLYDRIKYGE